MTNDADTQAEGQTVTIDFLYLDENVCVPCGGTSKALDEAVDLTASPLKRMGLDLKINKIHIVSEAKAITEKFLSSPTIRVNGKDIDQARTEDDCPSCGDLAGGETPVTCRTWHWKGETYKEAPVGRIVEAIMEAAAAIAARSDGCCSEAPSGCCGTPEPEESYELPENLKGFFAARAENRPLCC